MYLENIETVRDEIYLQVLLSNSKGRNIFVMRNVFIKIIIGDNIKVMALNNPVLLIDSSAYLFPNTGNIDENYLLNQLKDIDYHEVTYLKHNLEEQYAKDFDIVSDESTTDYAIKSSVQRRAYRRCEYKPREDVSFELGHYGTKIVPLLRKDKNKTRVNSPVKYTLIGVMNFRGTIEFNNNLIITYKSVELRNVYNACKNSGVDMLINGFSQPVKGTVYTKIPISN